MQVKLEDLPAELLVRSVWVIVGGIWEQLAGMRRAMGRTPRDFLEPGRVRPDLHETLCAQLDRRLEELEMLGHQLDAWILAQKAKEKRSGE